MKLYPAMKNVPYTPSANPIVTFYIHCDNHTINKRFFLIAANTYFECSCTPAVKKLFHAIT